MDDPQTKVEEAVRAFKERVMNADPSVRERAKDPGFAAKWDVAVRWQLAHGSSAAPATGAKVTKVPPPEKTSNVVHRGASPDTRGRPAPTLARPAGKTPSVSVPMSPPPPESPSQASRAPSLIPPKRSGTRDRKKASHLRGTCPHGMERMNCAYCVRGRYTRRYPG
jgi:hypothetical protein